MNGGTATLIGARNIHSDLPVDASKLLGMNYANFLVPLLREGTLALDFDDELVAGCALTHEGAVTHARIAELLEGAAR